MLYGKFIIGFFYVILSIDRRFTMVYFAYLIVATIVIVLSIKISDYVDVLDKNTKLSGAFLGGIMLSGVTSLPELFTSVSASALLRHPELCVGNVLGSDLFNLVALSVIILLNAKRFAKGRVSKSYRHVSLIVLVIYALLALNYMGLVDLGILHISITSVLIILVYFIGAKYLAIADDVETDEEMIQYQASKISNGIATESVLAKFVLTGIALIAFSIMMTVLTNEISNKLELTKYWAGAILLGVATSIPEVTATLRLFRLRNINIAVGNIIGSNLFNFLILVVADMVSLHKDVYVTPEFEVIKLMIAGVVATVMLYIMLRFKNKKTQVFCSAGIIVAYLGFLFV